MRSENCAVAALRRRRAQDVESEVGAALVICRVVSDAKTGLEQRAHVKEDRAAELFVVVCPAAAAVA